MGIDHAQLSRPLNRRTIGDPARPAGVPVGRISSSSGGFARRLGVLSLLLGLACATPATGRAEDLAALSAVTPVSAWGGQVVWSAFDGSRYHLMARLPGGIRVLPIAPRTVPFDADVGPDRDGAPAVVYSRCGVEEVRPGPGGRPGSLATGCDIFKLRLAAGAAEHEVRAISGRATSEITPAIWNGRVAFARRDDRGSRALRSLTLLYIQARPGSRRLVRIAGGAIPACAPGQRCTETPRTSTASLDVDSRRAAYLWWMSGPGVELGIAYEVRVASLNGTPSRQLEARGYGESEDWCDGSPRAPALARDAVVWPFSSDFGSCTSTLVRYRLGTAETTAASLKGDVLALATDGQQMLATWADGPFGRGIDCTDTAFSCRLVELPRPSFAVARARPVHALTPCWRYRPHGKRYCDRARRQREAVTSAKPAASRQRQAPRRAGVPHAGGARAT